MKNLAVRSMLLNANQDNEMIKKSLESQFQELSDKILLPLGDSRILEGILIEETASFSLNGYGLDQLKVTPGLPDWVASWVAMDDGILMNEKEHNANTFFSLMCKKKLTYFHFTEKHSVYLLSDFSLYEIITQEVNTDYGFHQKAAKDFTCWRNLYFKKMNSETLVL